MQTLTNFKTAISKFQAVAENYPNLKADQQMMRLQEELTTTENKISFTRQFYNDEVNLYNASLQVFPNNMIAGQFAFKPAEFFQLADEQARKAPEVKF